MFESGVRNEAQLVLVESLSKGSLLKNQVCIYSLSSFIIGICLLVWKPDPHRTVDLGLQDKNM